MKSLRLYFVLFSSVLLRREWTRSFSTSLSAIGLAARSAFFGHFIGYKRGKLFASHPLGTLSPLWLMTHHQWVCTTLLDWSLEVPVLPYLQRDRWSDSLHRKFCSSVVASVSSFLHVLLYYVCVFIEFSLNGGGATVDDVSVFSSRCRKLAVVSLVTTIHC